MKWRCSHPAGIHSFVRVASDISSGLKVLDYAGDVHGSAASVEDCN